MKKKLTFLIFFLLISISITNYCYAFWMWTPETNKWVNPKYAVKETPKEQLEYADSFLDAKQYEEAMKEYRKLLDHYPKARQAPNAQFAIGKCLEAVEEPYGAYKAYQLVIDKYPFSDLSAKVVERQYVIANEIMEGKDSRNKIIGALAGSKYDVIEIYRSVIKNAPYGQYAAPSQYKIGLYLLGKNLYQEARDEFEKTINDYPETQWAKAAKYQIAVSDSMRSSEAQYDQKVTNAAVKEFKQIIEQTPDAELSEKAKKQIEYLKSKEAKNIYLIARFYEKQKSYKAAKIYYQNIVDHYKDSKWAAEALKKILELSKKEDE